MTQGRDLSLAPFVVFLVASGLFVLAVILSIAQVLPMGVVFAALGLMTLASLWARTRRLAFERMYPIGVKLVPLTDSPEDGIVEEHGWVPIGLAATPAEAIEVLRNTYPDIESYQSFIVTGKSFHRPDDYLPSLNGDAYFIIDKDGPEDFAGYKGQWCEWITWQECKRGDERAVECWDIELREDFPLAENE